jgi:hypothetical protein
MMDISTASAAAAAYGKIWASVKTDIRALLATRSRYENEGENSFNLFKDLSPETYRHELYHSRILERILSPKTPEIFNSRYLRELVSLLRSKNKNVPAHDFGDRYTVVREEGKIDLFIHDDTHCIIIENKINNASDRDNQLARYYEYAARKKEIIAVVYLPLDPEKRPPLQSYTGKYKKYREKIEAVLVHLPAFTGDSKDDYAQGFLDRCAAISGAANNKTAVVFIEQYAKLIREIGGKQIMERNEKTKILKKLLGKNIKSAAEELDGLAEIWKDKDDLLGEIVSSRLQEKLGLKEKDGIIRKPINGKIRLEYWPWDQWIGFSGGKPRNIPSETKKKLEKLFTPKDFPEYFDTDTDNTSLYAGTYFRIAKFPGSIDDAVTYIAEKFNLLEKKAASVC